MAFGADLVLLVVLALDLADKWPSDALPGIRVLALVAAVVFAGTTYIHWESAKVRVPATHAAAALGLLGGALVVASVFSSGLDVIFRDLRLAAIGMLGITLSYVASQLSVFAQEDAS